MSYICTVVSYEFKYYDSDGLSVPNHELFPKSKLYGKERKMILVKGAVASRL